VAPHVTGRCSAGACRELGHLPPACPPGTGQRGWLHRRPADERPSRPGRAGHPPVPAGRADLLWDLRAAAGVIVIERPPGLPVPPRLHQRHPPWPRPAEERLCPGGPDHAPPGSAGDPARRPLARWSMCWAWDAGTLIWSVMTCAVTSPSTLVIRMLDLTWAASVW